MSTLRSYLITGLAMAVVGVGGLMLLISNAYPTLGPRWLFFFLLTIGVCGLALPTVAYLHRRFPSDPLVGLGYHSERSDLVWYICQPDCLAAIGKGFESVDRVFPAAGIYFD